MKTIFEHFSKQVVRILLSITLPCTAADFSPLDLGISNLNIKMEDIIAEGTPGSGVLALSKQQTKNSRTMDCIATGKITDKASWLNSMLADQDSYLGMLRENKKSSSDGYSSVGGMAFTSTGDRKYEFVFNRAEPRATLTNVIDESQYTILYNTMPNESIPTLQFIHDCILLKNWQASIGILRTPSNSDDMYALSVLDDQGNYMDFVVGCPIAESTDMAGLAQVKMDTQRLQATTVFLGTGYGVADIIAANHYALTHHMPEPTTATLGLAALAGLCTRRRRK